jgi:hypothetical protein
MRTRLPVHVSRADVSIRQHASAEHTSAYVSIRQSRTRLPVHSSSSPPLPLLPAAGSGVGDAAASCCCRLLLLLLLPAAGRGVDTTEGRGGFNAALPSEGRGGFNPASALYTSKNAARSSADIAAKTPPASSIRQHTSAYVSIRQHTPAYASIRRGLDGTSLSRAHLRKTLDSGMRQHTSAYVSIPRVSIRQHTSAYLALPRPSSQNA